MSSSSESLVSCVVVVGGLVGGWLVGWLVGR